MSEYSHISWTNATFNPWSGCVKISPACTFCYAAALPPSMRRGAEWGKDTPRIPASEAYWREPVKWNAKAAKKGERVRVFCASVADVFEARDDLDGYRARLWALIEATPSLDWLLLTKRPEEIMRRIPAEWRDGLPPNVWAGTTVENQKYADERIGHLVTVPARVRWLSMEPLCGPVDLTEYLDRLQWIVAGGESGHGARASDVQWYRDLRMQTGCEGVAFHMKQLGSVWALRVGAEHKKGGDPNEWPEDLRVRELPQVSA